MKLKLPLPEDKKLTVIFRVESGSLGPDGKDHVQPFCKKAGQVFKTIDADFINWQILPRNDKSLPEMAFKVANKSLTHDQADKYLAVFEKRLDEFEDHLIQTLSSLVGEYLGQ